ncbi:MAG TPA: RNA polymerase sigma factor [Acidobacteriaceae bacterium]|nr:RNA polymerase sigma factor [Acidobacteriaceae bacterium]
MPFQARESAVELWISEANGRSEEALLSLEQEIVGLFDEMRNRLLRYALSFGLSIPDGEDILQEVFLALFHHLRQGRSRANLRGWVFRVTHNLALKRRSANQRSPELAEADGAAEPCDPAPGAEEQLLIGERRLRLLAVLRALPETDERCLRLRAEGLRYREIAQVLGISLGAVSISLARSLARLERAEMR